MAKQLEARRELLNQWRAIEDQEEQEEEDDEHDASKRRRLYHLKEQWYADVFQYLISLPKETHIWCGAGDLMVPLLETFFNYSKEESDDSPLRRLWRRISVEMRQCHQCITQHHQAIEMYNSEYELSLISPLLDLLQSLNEERITAHLKEINGKLVQEIYDPACDYHEVVSVMYEVLMFPHLLDDQCLFTEFGKFIEAVDNIHDLALDGQQQFPGVYALFFFKRRVRLVGYRLAGSMGRLRGATDLEPLQPLIKKFIGFLETEGLPSAIKTSRPRAELDRLSIWLGLKSLLGFLEPPAFEEGILERYPTFLDIVLNHISGDSVDFSHAVTCLRLMFEMLGCKLWLRSTLSPSVMRNTLLGQCFHTRNEKSHKDIFDLFQPILQSLEALQDGEHEKQRRHFLYFLLHQVPVSSNFSVLTRQKARQIALLIVHRLYSMNPPCPPFECAHMWGPPLVLSLKDSLLHNSLRQPAFDLIEAVLVSDAAVLINSLVRCNLPQGPKRSTFREFKDDENDVRLLFADAKEMDDSSWKDFSVRSKLASVDFTDWMCIPMLWIDVLVDINPLNLPVSFSKAVFWARTRFAMVESELSPELVVPIRMWLSSCEISAAFGWKVPTGSNDGGDEKERRNSVRVSTMMLPLIRVFNRLTETFLIQAEFGELWKQWIWEPRMGESLILSLVDPNHSVRQFGKCILENVSDTRGLTHGLKFLCSSGTSLSAVLLGLRHAAKLVQVDSVVLKFQTLQHFFFVLRKLLDQGELPSSALPEKSCDVGSTEKFSSDGGFLRQPVFDSLPTNNERRSTEIDVKLLEKFCRLLSETCWPCIRVCLMEGRTFIDLSICQMTCVRVLEILPVVLGKFHPFKQSASFEMQQRVFEFSWLNDLVDWGKSTLKVVVIYWKRTVRAVLKLLKEGSSVGSIVMIKTIEDLISCDTVSMDELVEQVSRLSVSLSKEASNNNKSNISSKDSSLKVKESPLEVQPSPNEDTDFQILEEPATMFDKKSSFDLIMLSDDEKEALDSEIKLSDADKIAISLVDEDTSDIDPATKNKHGMSTPKYPSKAVRREDAADSSASHMDSGDQTEKTDSTSFAKSECVDSYKKERISMDNTLKSQARVNLKNSSDRAVISKKSNNASESVAVKVDDKILKEIVSSEEEDPLEAALNSLKRLPSFKEKPTTSVPKRQLIQLRTPVQNRPGHLLRLDARTRRFKPPRLDEWYKPILEMDYFATVGQASSGKDNHQEFGKLKEVPISFQSPEEYIDIFKPLVLEEFKAQLQSSFLERPSWEEMYFGVLSVLSAERVDNFHLVRFSHDDNDSTASKSFSENDLVLLTKEPIQKSSHDVHVVGKVERRERDNKRGLSILLIRFHLQNGIPRLNQARRNLLERSKWHASRIMSITPQLREFQALSSISDIPLLPTILKPITSCPTSNQCSKIDLRKLSQPLQQILKSTFNESQLQAISVAIGLRSPKNFELSLIQGPPGTGKTRTILAIASGLLASTPQKADQAANPLHDSFKKSNSTFPKISTSVAVARAWQDAALAKQLNEDMQQNPKPSDAFVRRRILICAQSNAAVDELVSRISSQGLYSSDGKMYKPYLVRVGNAKTVHPNSLPYFIDTLVDNRLADEMVKLSNAKNDANAPSSTTLRSNLEKLVDRIRYYEAKRANLSDGKSNLMKSLEDDSHKGDGLKEMSDSEVHARLRKLYEQKKQIYKDLSIAQAQERKTNEEMKGLKFKLRKSVLREAEIVITTLSGCGGDLYGVCVESMSGHKFGSPSEHTLFDAVVIDEAAQALEPATLIPLQLLKSNGVKCIMVGDPKQLPATVLSNVASKFQFECSMFERLQKAGHPVVMLTKQYRMHPEICSFPSLHFYERKLLNGETMSRKSAVFHETEGLGPYVFNDIIDGREVRGKNSGALSLYNEHEADAAVELLRFFKNRYPSECLAGRIGIITPYKCQLSLLRSRFSSAFGSSIIDDMEFNTVDGFQGREIDILILSTVRAADPISDAPRMNSSNIGFVADVRRMNVALTRARLSLWIMGNARTLQSNKNWAALIKDAKERNVVRTIKMPYLSMFKADSKKVTSAEKLNNHKAEDPQWHVKQRERSSEGIIDRRTSRSGDRSKWRDRERNSSSTMSTNFDNTSSEDRKSKISRNHIRHEESKGKESNSVKVLSDNSCSGKRKAELEYSGKSTQHHERESDGKLQKQKRPKTVSGYEVSERNREDNQTSSTAHETNRSSTSDLIAKRKKQREDVNAILDSALISSKKSETSAKTMPAKRRSSASSTPSVEIKPIKGRKD